MWLARHDRPRKGSPVYDAIYTMPGAVFASGLMCIRVLPTATEPLIDLSDIQAGLKRVFASNDGGATWQEAFFLGFLSDVPSRFALAFVWPSGDEMWFHLLYATNDLVRLFSASCGMIGELMLADVADFEAGTVVNITDEQLGILKTLFKESQTPTSPIPSLGGLLWKQ